MPIAFVETYPPQPGTERARRTGVAADRARGLFAYASGKVVVVRSADSPQTARAVYRGHLHAVTAVAFAANGDVASGDASGQVHVWRVGDDAARHTHHVLAGRVNALAWCPDSQRIVAAGAGKDRLACAFLADTGNAVGEIAGHAGEINAVALRPARPLRAVTAGENGLVVFHEGPPFKFAHSKQTHQNAVSDVAYSPDGAAFVTAGWDRKLALYDGKSGEFQSFIDTQHDGMILAVSFLTNDLVLTASTDATVRLSSVSKHALERTFALDKQVANQVVGVAAVSDAQFVSVTLAGDVRIWDACTTQRPLARLQGHQGAVTALGLHAGSLYSGAADGSVVQWTPDGGVKTGTHEGPVCALVGDLLSVGWDRRIAGVDGATELHASDQPVAAAKAGDAVVVVSEHFVEVVGGHKAELYGAGTAVDATAKLAVVGHGTAASVYALPALELLHTLPARLATVSAVQISPDGAYVAVGDASGKIGLYALADYSLKTSRWAFHTSKVTAIRWTADSKYVVTGALDTNIYIYSVDRPGKNDKLLGAHKDGVNAVVWGDKDTVYSGGADGTVSKWTVTWP